MFNRLFSLKSTKIKVIGVGGGGNNIVNHLADCELEGLSLIACDLDATTLSRSKASVTLQLGSSGLGAGSIVGEAQSVAQQNVGRISKLFASNTDLLFVISCLGGGCGSGVTPIIAHEAKKMGITTIGVFTIPFQFEGEGKMRQALETVKKLSNETDAIFLFNNQYIMRQCRDLPLDLAFANIDELMSGVIAYITQFMSMQVKCKEVKKMSLSRKLKTFFSSFGRKRK